MQSSSVLRALRYPSFLQEQMIREARGFRMRTLDHLFVRIRDPSTRRVGRLKLSIMGVGRKNVEIVLLLCVFCLQRFEIFNELPPLLVIQLDAKFMAGVRVPDDRRPVRIENLEMGKAGDFGQISDADGVEGTNSDAE